jgi:hypothetical protein
VERSGTRSTADRVFTHHGYKHLERIVRKSCRRVTVVSQPVGERRDAPGPSDIEVVLAREMRPLAELLPPVQRDEDVELLRLDHAGSVRRSACGKLVENPGEIAIA